MDRFDDGVRRRREKAVDLMRAGDRFRFRPAVALELGPDAGEAGQRPIVIDREPDDVLLFGLRVRLRRVFGEAVERHQAAAFSSTLVIRQMALVLAGRAKTAAICWGRNVSPLLLASIFSFSRMRFNS
jgi:hypothetical protein